MKLRFSFDNFNGKALELHYLLYAADVPSDKFVPTCSTKTTTLCPSTHRPFFSTSVLMGLSGHSQHQAKPPHHTWNRGLQSTGTVLQRGRAHGGLMGSPKEAPSLRVKLVVFLQPLQHQPRGRHAASTTVPLCS